MLIFAQNFTTFFGGGHSPSPDSTFYPSTPPPISNFWIRHWSYRRLVQHIPLIEPPAKNGDNDLITPKTCMPKYIIIESGALPGQTPLAQISNATEGRKKIDGCVTVQSTISTP